MPTSLLINSALMIMHYLQAFLRLVRPTENMASHAEKLLSATGGSLCIGLIISVTHLLLDIQTSLMITASMGASAVLVFAVPHGALSQPWPVFGGHVLSALIGVACYQWLPSPVIAASFAVGLAIAVMYYLGCLHPPGGATALLAVIGGPAIHQLGFQFALYPVLINVVILLIFGVLYNRHFHWRLYPTQSSHMQQQKPLTPIISETSVILAMQELDSFIDITAEEFIQLVSLAQMYEKSGLEPKQLSFEVRGILKESGE